MDQADSCIAEPQIELTTAVDNNVTTPNLTHMAKSPFSTVKPAFSDMYDPWGICRSCWVPVYEEFAAYKRRLCTYDTWLKQMNPKPEELTRAGFFYSEVSDTVYCFHCGQGVHAWEFVENPFIAHKTWSPECTYLNMVYSW